MLRARAWIVALAASLLVVLATTRVHQGLYADPATQLKAVQQRLAGESTSINRLVQPDAGDLSRDAGSWIVWWTPGTELATYPLMRLGLPLGTSVRIVAASTLVAGAIGWTVWFAEFALPPAIVLGLAAGWPFLRHASNGLFFYSAEMLVFAAAPWLLVATARFLDRDRGVWPARDAAAAAAIGLALGGAYWLKGSLGFVAVGVLLAIAHWERQRASSTARWLVVVGSAACGAALPFLTLSVVNRAAGGGAATQVSAAFRISGPAWRNALDAIALPALQLADAGSVWQYVLMHPAHPIVRNATWISMIALPGGVLLWWLVARPRIAGAAAATARSVFVASVGALVAIWTVSDAVSHEPRHLAAAAFGLLPLALAEGHVRWQGAGPSGRRLLAAAAVFYVCVPLAYGAASVVQKVRRYPTAYEPGPARLYNGLLSESSIAGVREALLATVTPADVWYLPEPISALDLPGRAIVSAADFDPIDRLRATRFMTSRPVRVNALLPARFEANGKGAAIRASFPQAGPWTRTAIARSDYVMWTSDLRGTR
jgi:hypothetical protein